MDKIAAAYIAGLLDGEGCFRIDRFRTARSPIGFQYRPTVELTMCDRKPVEYVAKLTDRKVRWRRLRSSRTAYTIIWRNSAAADLIQSILPYLLGKKEQAELCLHFDTNLAPGRGRSYRQEDKAEIERIRLKVADLKKPYALRC